MAKLEDYGLRHIWHGAWSDPEIEWKKSNFQTLVFNYWDCVECFENDYEYDLTKEEDIETLLDWLYDMTPDSYNRPRIDYEWTVSSGRYYGEEYDDCDYYKDYKLSHKEDFVLHSTSQALRQALSFLNDNGCSNADIQIFRQNNGKRQLVANYALRGSTLQDVMYYGKKAA